MRETVQSCAPGKRHNKNPPVARGSCGPAGRRWSGRGNGREEPVNLPSSGPAHLLRDAARFSFTWVELGNRKAPLGSPSGPPSRSGPRRPRPFRACGGRGRARWRRRRASSWGRSRAGRRCRRRGGSRRPPRATRPCGCMAAPRAAVPVPTVTRSYCLAMMPLRSFSTFPCRSVAPARR